MRRKSIWLLVALMVVSLVFALAGCGGEETLETEYKLSETEITLAVEETKKLTISPAPEAAVTWSSDATAVATVEGGTVTAVKEGTANISAAIAGAEKPLTCKVTVTKKQGGGDITETTYQFETSEISIKTTETFQLKVLDEEGKEVTAGVTYTSENAAVASVSETGLITGVAAGSTSVKAAVGGETLTATVTVSQKYAFTLTPGSLDIAAGAKARLTLTSTPARPEGARPHTFTSSNTAVATVDGGSGEVTGVAKGTATITCSVEGQEVTATVTVTEYTVKIGDAVMTDSTAVRVGEDDKQITVTADPATHAVEATYASSNEQAVTLTSDHKIHAVAAGESDVTVTVGGRTFTTHVTVSSAVQYTLKADGEDIADETVTMKLGDTVTLSVERDPEGALPAIAYDSDDDAIAEVSTAGVIEAKGVGTTTITVEVEGANTFEITVNVLYDVKQTEVDYSDPASVNLDALDETNVTLDWRYFGKDSYTDRKNGGNLIGDLVGTKGPDFTDYRVAISWTDGTTTQKQTSGRTDGLTFNNTSSVSFDVKVTKDVKYISVFTGAYHSTNTVTISYHNMVCASVTFENNGNNDSVNKCKQIVFTPDQAHFVGTEMTFTIKMEVGAESAHGWTDNLSLVAIAVVGNTEREEDAGPSATAEAPVTTDLTNETRNLSVIGTEDWVYAKNGNNGGLVRRSGVPNVIKENDIQYTGGDGTDRLQEAFGRFTWYEQDSSAAPDGGSVNNMHWANETWSVPIHLTAGKHVVTLFLSGWKNSYSVGVLDSNANVILAATKVVTGYGTDQGVANGGNKAVEVKIVITVTTEDTFTFRMTKEGEGNHGWAAIAVGYATDLTLEKTGFDLTKDVAATEKVVVKKGDATETASFASSDPQVVTVDQASGVLTIAGTGRAIVTATVGEVKLRAFVTVTEYTLKSGTEVTMPQDGSAQIEITADPARSFTVEYKVTEGDSVKVDEAGVIQAQKLGKSTVTATVAGKVFTITVNVVDYKLSKTEIELTLGGENATDTLEMQQGDGTKVEGVTFTSEDDKIASVNETTGAVTATGFGKTVVKAKLGGVVLECNVTVKLKVTVAQTDYADGSNETVNLDELDETNATLDWRFFRNDNVHEMAGGNLIGDLDRARSGNFGDYRTHITWNNGDDKEKASYFGYTDGWTFKSEQEPEGTVSVSFDVKVTKDVKYIAIFTGAWHAKNKIAFSYGGVEYAQFEFSNNGKSDAQNKNKKLVFTPDMANFGTEEKTFTITLTVWGEEDNGWKDNVSLVAIAVVGNAARAEKKLATAAEKHEATANGAAVDLTAVGTLDWAYICDDQNGLVTKQGDSHVIYGINCIGGQGEGHDSFANQSFTWSNGTKETQGTAKFKWCDNVQAICVTLTQSAKVTLWISAWKGSVDLTVYDRGTAILNAARVIQGDGNNSQGVKVEVTLTVTEASTFTFLMKKDGDGNFGLGAIAAANVAAE